MSIELEKHPGLRQMEIIDEDSEQSAIVSVQNVDAAVMPYGRITALQITKNGKTCNRFTIDYLLLRELCEARGWKICH